METIHAACTMDWSIELEKGLRSKKPGASMEAILKIGSRLEQWKIEAPLSVSAYNMFGLVPGEDRLFANTILFRLTEAFRLGDKHIRLSVLKVFLSELRRRHNNRKRIKSGKGYSNGILSKSMVDNPLELLNRVKIVFDSGDVESRAFSLILFGCWADFAKDNADIRYLILSSLISSHVLETKASLFAVGCFCELLEDFAYVVLEILADIVNSPMPAVRLAGARVFPRLGCSFSVADRAYKLGKKLVLEFPDDDFLVVMLVSLSKLASRSTLLISEQVEFLFSYLTHERTLQVQTTALRCLRNILARGVCHFHVSAHTVKTLFGMLDEPQLSSAMQCEVLCILHKILLYRLPTVLCTNTLEISKLVIIVENASRSPFIENRHLAMRILINIGGKLSGRTEMDCGGFCSDSLLSRVISLVIDQLTLLVKQVPDFGQAQVGREAQCLLNLLLCLIEEHPDLCILMLDRIHSVIEIMVTLHDIIMPTMKSCSLAHEAMESKAKKSTSISSKLVIYIYRFMVAFLEILNEADVISLEIFQKMEMLVRQVHQCSLFDWYTHTLYSLLLHSYSTWDYTAVENSETCKLDRNLGIKNLVEQENLSIVYVKKMLLQNDNWSTYKVGLYAACQGSWLLAAFIFEQLITKVQSNSCYCWLKFLAQFAHSEREIQFLLIPKMSSILVNWVEDNRITVMPSRDDFGVISQEAAQNTDLPNYSEKLVSAYSSICSSREALEANAASGEAFYFQKWFLNLRVKVLETVLNIHDILATFSLDQDNVPDNDWDKRTVVIKSPKKFQQVSSLVYSLTQISRRLTRLARKFDLMVTSFVGMDRKSLEVISALALSCSVLAFSSGFACLISSDISPRENLIVPSLEKSENISNAMLIENLIVRLRHVDHETCTKLRLLLKLTGESKRSFHLLSRNQIASGSSEVRKILRVCSYAVAGVSDLRHEANTVHNKEMLSRATKDGLQLLSNIIRKWIHIPFRTPKSFFRIRPWIGAELFAINSDLRNPDCISVLPGFQLSLNICVQLKNVPSDFQIGLTKLYSILYCKTSMRIPSSSKENKGKTWFGRQVWEADDMVDLNDKLLQYATECTKRTNSQHCSDTDKDVGVANAYLCFEPNERGQGFSTCLLDVSCFPAGAYEIRWLSCCIDSQGVYWSLLPLNAGPVFTVQKSPIYK